MKFRLRTSYILWIAVGVLLIGGVVKFLFFQPINVPKDFADARQRSVNIAQGIARMSSDSLVDISRTAGLDKAGRIGEAMAIVQKAIITNQQARAQAVQLSATLEVMAKNLGEISPYGARDLATEALGYEVTLINHLITLNDYLNQLFIVLQDKFHKTNFVTESDVAHWINLVNGEVDAISVLNRKYNDTMIKFDHKTSRS